MEDLEQKRSRSSTVVPLSCTATICSAVVWQSRQPSKDFREVLLQQSEVEEQDIALAIELFTDGSLNTFAKQTNVNTRSRFICYDIHELGKQLMPIGMLVCA